MVEERWAELERAIAAEDLHRAIDICVAVTERERAELRDRLNAKFGLPTPLHWIACIPLGEAAMAAVTAVAEKPWLEFRYDEVHTRWQDIVAARRPAWREQWARLVIDVPWIDEMWLAYLDLRRAGVCEMTYDFDYVAARFGDVRRRINQSPQVDDELRDTVIWLAFDLGVPIDVSIVDGLVELRGPGRVPARSPARRRAHRAGRRLRAQGHADVRALARCARADRGGKRAPARHLCRPARPRQSGRDLVRAGQAHGARGRFRHRWAGGDRPPRAGAHPPRAGTGQASERPVGPDRGARASPRARRRWTTRATR